MVLIANEVIDSTLRSNKRANFCKFDIEKTYDSVNRSILCIVLEKMGFVRKWIERIKWCISTTSFFVLVNGIPIGIFRSSRGLRLGDPHPLFCFVIAMEAFKPPDGEGN